MQKDIGICMLTGYTDEIDGFVAKIMGYADK